MKKLLFVLMSFITLGVYAQNSLYDYTVKDLEGEDVSMKDYSGKVLLIVNTATKCGFTPQYAPIEQLYKDYHDKGLEILDIPCNQFGGQAPGTETEAAPKISITPGGMSSLNNQIPSKYKRLQKRSGNTPKKS